MNRKEIGKLVWECFEERIPEMLRGIEDMASGVIFSGGKSEYDETWRLDREECAIILHSNADGVLEMNLKEPCHKVVHILMVDPEAINEVNETEVIELISLLCKTFVAGNWHILLDFICETDNWKVALEAYLDFEKAHPEIVVPITYFGA